MKGSIWDILSIVMLLSTLCLCGVIGYLLFSERSVVDPFPAPTLQPTIRIDIPTATTVPTLRSMPPTWTPTPEGQQDSSQPNLRPTSTPLATNTLFVIPSFTPSPTQTPTPTSTATPTRTGTFTPFPTDTLVPTFTLSPESTP